MSENELNEMKEETQDIPNAWRRPALIAGGVVVSALVFLGVWYFLIGKDTTAGHPVPAPRNISRDETPATNSSAAETITIPTEQIRTAGIEIEQIGEQLATDVGLKAAAGRIEQNAYRSVPAISLAGGIVKSVRAELGDFVKKGEIIAVIFSNEFAEAQSRYITLKTEAENARANFERTKRLVNINQPGRSELDAAQRQLKSAEAALNEMQNRFARTKRLIAIGAASREELDQDTTRLRTAEADVAEAKNRYERSLKLLEISPEVKSQNEEAMNRLRAIEGDLAAARERLLLFGLDKRRIDSLRDARQISADLRVIAPISGTVTERIVNPGEAIEANKQMIKVTDLSSVWVIAEVVERDLARLRIGSSANVSTDAFPDRIFRGRVAYIDPTIDEKTRTAKVRVEIDNLDRMLRLEMYVNVSFAALEKSARTVPVVPSAAIQEINGRTVIFIVTDEPNRFEIRPVLTGGERGGRIPLLEGANVGERVVTRGAFLLRAEWSKMNQAAG
ncbi:MAG: hypothetical protein C4324_01355 [Blastocatellia bacterium]